MDTLSDKRKLILAGCSAGFVATASVLVALEYLFSPQQAGSLKLLAVMAWTVALASIAWTAVLSFVMAPLSTTLKNTLGRVTPGITMIIVPYTFFSFVVTILQLFIQYGSCTKILWACQIIFAGGAAVLLALITFAGTHSRPTHSDSKVGPP